MICQIFRLTMELLQGIENARLEHVEFTKRFLIKYVEEEFKNNLYLNT